MAASTILLRRSTACFIGSGSQFYCRYLSAAAKRSHVIIPTSVSSVRRFSSSSLWKSDRIITAMAEIESISKEIESTIRKEIKGKKKPPIVKEKHPLPKNIESDMSESEELNREAQIASQISSG